MRPRCPPALVVLLALGCLCCASARPAAIFDSPVPSFRHRYDAYTTPIHSLASWATSGIAAAALPEQQHLGTSANSLEAAQTAPHKPLLPGLDKWDVLLLCTTAVTLLIAAGGGIGGGAVFVVLNVFIGGFTAAQAVALSNITILGGSLANFLANSRRRHPVLARPLIDYDLILVMEPTTMLGALLGGYMNKLLPVWLTSCLLATLLLLLTWKLLKRGSATFIAESCLKRQQQQQQQQQGKQRRSAIAAASAQDQQQLLRQPLLLDEEAAGAYSDDDGGGGGGGGDADSSCAADTGPGGSSHAKQQQQQEQEAAPLHEHQAAWTDAGLTGQAAPIVAVPAALRPLSIMTYHESLAQEEQQGSARSGASGSAKAAAAAGRAGDRTPPLIWGVPAPASASFAAEEQEAAGRQGSLGSAQQQQHQQRLRWGLSRCWPWLSTKGPMAGSLSAILASEARQLPWQPLVTLLLLSAWVVASDTLKVHLPCGSLSYWLVACSIVPPAALVTLLVRHWLLAKTAVKAAAAEACVGDSDAAAAAAQAVVAHAGGAGGGGSIHWTPKNSVQYPLMCSAAGVVAGLFGVGGGIIKGPLMLELGVCPEVSAATSATMIMFTAGSAAVVYWNFGGVVPDYAAAAAVLGFFVTLLGQFMMVRLVRALGRRSLIIFMMGALMTLASVAASYQTVLLVAAALRRPGSMWDWDSICSV